MLDVIRSSSLPIAATAAPVTMSTTLPIRPSDRSWIILARGNRERLEMVTTLTAIVRSHKQSQIDELLPWNYAVKV